MKIKFILIFALAMMSAVSTFAEAHPAYLHALSDLRAARWYLEHRPSDWQQTKDEVAAVSAIDAAIGEIKKASIDDGKNLNDHPPVQEVPDRAGRLHKALDLLRKIHADVNKVEQNEGAKGLKVRALGHIDEAAKYVEMALKNK